MGFFIPLIGILVFILIIIYVFYEHFSDKSDKLKEKVKEMILNTPLKEEFNISQDDFFSANLSRIAIDEQNKKIAIWKADGDSDPKNPTCQTYVYRFDEILEVELIENGQTITRTSRGSQIAGVAVGGALLGGVGAVIGGLSGSTTSSDTIKNVDLKIVVNDFKKPFHKLRMLDSVLDMNGSELQRGTPLYDLHMEKVFHWHSILAYIIKL